MHKQQASELFKLLGDENRVKIMKVLMNNDEVCACKFIDMVDCKQATLSHHLSLLAKANLITSRKEGTKVLYSCNKPLVEELMGFLSTPCKCTKVN